MARFIVVSLVRVEGGWVVPVPLPSPPKSVQSILIRYFSLVLERAHPPEKPCICRMRWKAAEASRDQVLLPV